jgi:hypothetical protein
MALQSNATLSAAFELATVMSSLSSLVMSNATPLTQTQVAVVAESAAGIARIAQSAFEILCFLAGVTGTAANGFLLFVLFYEKHVSKNATNKFVCNQTILDGLACIAYVVYIAVQWATESYPFPQGAVGWIRCLMVESAITISAPINASQFNLIVISVERYAMVVHPIAHRKHFRPWMVHFGLVAPWFNGCITYLIPALTTTRLVGNECLVEMFWVSPDASGFFSLAVFLWQFLIPIMIIVFCYARIIAVIRHQTLTIRPITKMTTASQHSATGTVSPGTGENSKTFHSFTVSEATAHTTTEAELTVPKTEKRITRTMIIIVSCFVIFWLPLETFIVFFYFLSLRHLIPLLYILSAVAFVNLVVNPIVYGAHFRAWHRAFRVVMNAFKKTGDGSVITSVH